MLTVPGIKIKPVYHPLVGILKFDGCFAKEGVKGGSDTSVTSICIIYTLL